MDDINSSNVNIVDVSMPFMSMVVFEVAQVEWRKTTVKERANLLRR